MTSLEFWPWVPLAVAFVAVLVLAFGLGREVGRDEGRRSR